MDSINNTRKVMPGEFYKHFKNKLYQIVTVAKHSETGELYVVYQALYGDYATYVRPYEMFISEVDHVKYPEIKQKYRFEKFEPAKEENFKAEAVKPKEPIAEPKNSGVNAYLLGFLDTDTNTEKIEYLRRIRNKVDDKFINDISAALDITVNEGDIDTRVDAVLACLLTRARFETSRFR